MKRYHMPRIQKVRGVLFAALMMALTAIIPSRNVGYAVGSADPVRVADSNLKISLDDGETRVLYGKYSEAEALLEGVSEGTPVEWNVAEYSLPPGLELEHSNSNRLLIFGNPVFTGYWCFVLSAKVQGVGDQAFKEVCYFGDDNDDFQYPRFLTDRLLPIGQVHQSYSERILIDRTTAVAVTGQVVDGALPSGFELVPYQENFEFYLKGRPTVQDRYGFALKVEDPEGFVNFRQFLLIVQDNLNPPPHFCPAGQHWDSYLNRCVYHTHPYCPVNTYYDPYTGRCVFYNQHTHCPWGYHWSWNLHRCVANVNPHPHPMPHPQPMPMPMDLDSGLSYPGLDS